MGGKSRKTGGISLALIKRIKGDGKKTDDAPKKKCGKKIPADNWNPFDLGETKCQ